MVKKRVTISVNTDLVKWIELMIEKGIFFNVSHAFQYCVMYTKDKNEGIVKLLDHNSN